MITKQFIAFVRKEFYHIFRDRRTMLILLVMPIVQIILFGFAITTEVKNAHIAIMDESNDIITRRIIERVNSSEYFTITEYHKSINSLYKSFQKGDIDMALIFKPNFSNNIYNGKADVQIISDATDPNMANMKTTYASNIINEVTKDLMPNNIKPVIIKPEIKLLFNPQMKSAYNFVPGVMGLILMLICAMMTSISIVREKEIGTMEVLLVSPVKPLFIILAKAIPYFVLSFIDLISILLLSVYVLNVPIAGSLFWVIIISLLFIFVSLSLGLLVSTIAKTQVVAMLLSGLVLMMPTIFLSGMVFPIESMPNILQYISALLPVRWYIQAIRRLMIQGVDITYVSKEVVILIGMAIFFIVISLKKFKKRLE